jgi:hypothetical protein
LAPAFAACAAFETIMAWSCGDIVVLLGSTMP